MAKILRGKHMLTESRSYLGKTTMILIFVWSLVIVPACKKETVKNPAEKIIPVHVDKVATDRVEYTLTRVGSMASRESVLIRTQTEAYVSKIFFEEGKRVRKGQTLVKLKDLKLQAEVRSLEAKVRQAEARLANSLSEKKRKEALVRENVVPQQAFDDLLARVKMEQASVEQLKADLSYAVEKLKDTEIRAPFAGVTAERLVSTGSFLKVGDPVVRLVQLNPLEIGFRVDERYKTNLYAGQEISVRVAAYPDRRFSGKVFFISPDVEAETRTFLVKGAVDNNRELLNPGMFAEATIVTEVHEKTLVVPWDAIVEMEQEIFLYKLEGRKARKIPVRLGVIRDNRAEVFGDLRPGDVVVTEGKFALKDGSGVEVKAAKK